MNLQERQKREISAYEELRQINPELKITREMIDARVYTEEPILYIGDVSLIRDWRIANGKVANRNKVYTVLTDEYIEHKFNFENNDIMPFIRTMRGRSDVVINEVRVFGIECDSSNIKFIEALLTLLSFATLSKENKHFCKDGQIEIIFDSGEK